MFQQIEATNTEFVFEFKLWIRALFQILHLLFRSKLNRNRWPHSSLIFFKKSQFRTRCVASSPANWQSIHIFGSFQPLCCNLGQVRIASFSNNHMKILTFNGYLTFHIHSSVGILHPPFMKWLYIDETVKWPPLPHLQTGLSYLSLIGIVFSSKFSRFLCSKIADVMHGLLNVIHQVPRFQYSATIASLSRASA